jgi:hypothetical protein
MAGSAPIRSLPNASRKLEAVDGKIEREMGRVQSHDDVFASEARSVGKSGKPGGELVQRNLGVPQL